MILIDPRIDAARYRVFSDFGAAAAAYAEIATNVDPRLPGLRQSICRDPRSFIAHPTLLRWAVTYDRLAMRIATPPNTTLRLSRRWRTRRAIPDVVLVTQGDENAAGWGETPTPAAVWTDQTVPLRVSWRSDSETSDGLVPLSSYLSKFSPDNAIARILRQAGFRVACQRTTFSDTSFANGWGAQIGTRDVSAALDRPAFTRLVHERLRRLVWVWIHGEADANTRSPAENYASNLLSYWDNFAATFSSYRPRGVIVQLDAACSRPFTAAIRAAQASVVAARPQQLTLIDPSSIGLGVGDGLHRDAENNIDLGLAVATEIAMQGA